MPTHQENEPQGQQGQRPQRRSGQYDTPEQRKRRWRDLVEELLTEARERGAFDNLRGAGQPLHLEDDVYAGDNALAYSLLKQNNLAPPEIERGNEIDAELARAEKLLDTLRRRRDALEMRSVPAFVSQRRAYNLTRQKTEAAYEEALRGINSKILSLNILAPSALHRRTINVEARLRAFREEFPAVSE